MQTERINSLIIRQHNRSRDAGWWTNLETREPINPDTVVMEKLMLIITEISETADLGMDAKLPHRTAFEVEMADVVLRTTDLLGALGMKFWCEQDDDDRYGNDDKQFCSMVHATAAAAEFWRKQNREDFNIALNILLYICFTTVNIDLWGAIEEKMAYNAARLDHTLAHRASKDGKKC